MSFTYKHTVAACFLSSINQASINNLIPLLFVTFQQSFSVSLSEISVMITISFGVQLITDVIAVRYIDKIGFRAACILSNIFSALGLSLLALLPNIMAFPYAGIIISVIIMAIGSGLCEVSTSPVLQSLPLDNKSGMMSLMHSFYCWGHVGVVLISTLYFVTIGIDNWMYLALMWGIIPLINIFLFIKSPMVAPLSEHTRTPTKKLFTSQLFLLAVLLMICSGAAEQSISQWASYFAEQGLKVTKTVGNLLGPCAFAALMGLARLLYALFSPKLNLKKMLMLSSLLCIGCYFVTVFVPISLVSLLGCALCGFSVGIMWPGMLSLCAENFPNGGGSMFAILALAGDIGCMAGPTLVGIVSDHTKTGRFISSLLSTGGTDPGLKTGLLIVSIFPIIMFIGLLFFKNKKQKRGA